MKNIVLLFFCIIFCNAQLTAQEFSYGFKAGLNFSKFNGPSEEDDQGKSLETFNFNTGFHVGASFIYKFTDLYGAKAELMFSQKGGKVEYSGAAFQDFPTTAGAFLRMNGERVSYMNISTSYIDIPVLAYGRILPWLEISGGFNVGVLINSTATGEIEFLEASLPDGRVKYNLDYNYSGDDLLDLATYEADNYNNIPIDGTNIIVPQIAAGASAGAYFDFEEKLGKLYKPIAFGLDAGVSFFINSGLFVGYRLNYGLSDVTNNDADVSRAKTGQNNEYILRADKDSNLSMQASVGFSF